ncbi:MAG: aminoglycoside phosphotransferase family protein [Acidobacteriota bacterium]
MRSLPLPATGLPAFAALLGGDLWERWLLAGKVFPLTDLCRSIRYLRLKPRTSCRLAIFKDQDISDGSRPPDGFLVYAFPDAERAAEFFDKVTSGKLWAKEQEHEPFLDREHAVAVVPFPSDREIPGLRHVYRHHRLKQIVLPFLPEIASPGWRVVKRKTSLRLLNYKTGRRAVFAYTIHAQRDQTAEQREITLHLKAECGEDFAEDRLTALRELAAGSDDAGWQLPEIVGWDVSHQLTFRRWYPGSVLSSRLDDPESLDRVAVALAGLHRCSVRSAAFAPVDPIATIQHEIENLAMLLPAEDRRLRHIGDRVASGLAPARGADETLLHGDFHPGQVVFHNGQVVLIDLDRCRYGSPALDVGSFLAHAVELSADPALRQRFVDAYRAERAELDPDSLRAAFCLGLLQRCARPFRDLVPDWPRLIGQRLERLERALDGADR